MISNGFSAIGTVINLFLIAASFHSYANAHSNLINGRLAPMGTFPFVGTNGSCTVTKVGPRQFLYAGHCLSSRGDGEKAVLVFNPLNLENGKKVKLSGKIFVHQSWLDFLRICRKCNGSDLPQNDDPLKSDIALFIADNETTEIPWADIDFSTFETNGSVEVVMAGYGCTRNIVDPKRDSGALSPLRYSYNTLQHSQILNHPGSLYRGFEVQAGESNWISKAYAMDNVSPALCSGDSGGPLLRKSIDGSWKVIGVAHNYTFTHEYEAGIPMTNLHTRIDDNSFHKIGVWLRSKWNL